MSHEDHHPFEVAAGSVTGRAHALSGKPNQDAVAVRSRGGCLVAVVADGCGSGAHSEVGAQLGARIVAELALGRLAAGERVEAPALWDGVRDDALGALGAAARSAGADHAGGVADLFLFTVLGLAIAGDRAVVFGIGDGIFAIERAPLPPDRGAPEAPRAVDRARIGPFPGNAPPYLGYGLLGGGPRFTLHRALATADLGAVLLGTDGAADLDALADRRLPGSPSGEPVGPLSQLWRDDQYFRNRDAIRRRLALINRDASRPIWAERRIAREPGLLEDDTTVVAIRRRRARA